jgi:hypothetical protein
VVAYFQVIGLYWLYYPPQRNTRILLQLPVVSCGTKLVWCLQTTYLILASVVAVYQDSSWMIEIRSRILSMLSHGAKHLTQKPVMLIT